MIKLNQESTQSGFKTSKKEEGVSIMPGGYRGKQLIKIDGELDKIRIQSSLLKNSPTQSINVNVKDSQSKLSNNKLYPEP